jgi:nucleotide-binding universal stress UspA family protein
VNPLTRVLTAVDFSEPARAAFEHALVLSRTHNAELTVVHAVPGDRSFEWDSHERIAMLAALREAAEAAGVRFKERVQHGDPAGMILLHASVERPDLIVLGTHRRSGFDRFRFGSVAETVTLRATQPVLIVPTVPVGKSADAVMSFNSILVAVDFSPGSIAAVERALSMAHANSRVTLVHVVPRIPLANVSRYSYHLSEPDYHSLLARDAWSRLQELISINTRREQKVHARVVIGDPSTDIVRVATDVDADVILAGVTFRGPIGRRLVGSTAARVIRIAERPVLAIPELVGQTVVPLSKEGQRALAA